MKLIFFTRIAVFLAILIPGLLGAQDRWPENTISGLQHAGAIHFYVSRGNLEIVLYQKDATRSRRALTGILTGPDGQVLDKKLLLTPDSEPVGNLQKGVFKAENLMEGVYTLFIISERSRHLDEHTIAFSTNADKYVINSGAAHVDAERREYIVFDGSNEPPSVFFKPVKDQFEIEITDMNEAGKPVELWDGKKRLVKSVLPQDGKVLLQGITHNQSGVWELRLPSTRARVLIEGLNHRFAEGRKPLPVWSTGRELYFDLEKIHWLLDPRRVAGTGESGTINFTVFNSSDKESRLNLTAIARSFPGKLQVLPQNVTLRPGETASVAVRYDLKKNTPRGQYSFQLVARDNGSRLQNFAQGEVKVGFDKNQPVSLPIPLNIYEHNQPYFAYQPGFPRENQVYFDTENRAWVVTPDSLNVKVGEVWKKVPVAEGRRVNFPSSVIGFDREGNVYTIVQIDQKPYLLRTNSSFQQNLAPLPEGGNYWVETWMGGQTSPHIPIVTRYLLNPDKKQVAMWAKVHDLQILIPEFTNGELKVGKPILISNNCVGMSAHSGIPSAVASEGDLVHIVWGETSDPKGKDPGVPNFTVTYNRKTGTLTQPRFLAFSPPVNDVHNISSILVDSKGTRHVVIGAHGRPFQHLKAVSGSDQWTEPVQISDIDQTYVGAVLDRDDRITVFFRGWRRDLDYPSYMNAGLFYQTMEANGNWNQPVLFATPGLNNYSIFYHRATVDRNGRAFISFTYWSTWTTYRDSFRNGAGPLRDRLVLFSDDKKEWYLWE